MINKLINIIQLQDVDECIINKPCAHGKFCVNNEGSYRCVKCDKVR